MMPIHRRHSAMICIAPTLTTRTRGLRLHPRHHHHRQWEATVEKVQHNLLCGHTTRTTLSLFTCHIYVFVVWFNYLRYVRFSRRNSVSQFGTCCHMPFHVFCVLNYIMPYFVRFYLQYVISFHYVHNIKLNIMATDNENNNIMKSPIL